MKKSIVVTIIICIIVAIVGIFAVFLGIKNKGGVKAVSKADIETDNIAFFSQKDSRWKDERLGESKYSIEKSGCLLICITSIIEMQNIDNDLDEITPPKVNTWFGDNNVYDDEGNILWDKLGSLLGKEIIRENAGGDTSNEIESFLKSGVYPIVRVKTALGRPHYVLIVGSKDGEFMCMDPLETSNETVSLSKYDNKIYALRVVK